MTDEQAIARSQPMLTLIARILGMKTSAVEAMLDDPKKIDELADRAADALDDARQTGESKLVGMLGKLLKKEGFTQQIEKLDAAAIKAIKDHFASKEDDPAPGSEKETITNLRKKVGELETQITTITGEHETALTAKDKEVSRQKTMFEVRNRAKDALKTLNANIPGDEKVANRKFEKLMKELEANDYVYSEKDDDYLQVDKDGNPVRGENKLPLKLSDTMNDAISVDYGLLTVDEKDAGGLPADKSKGKPPVYTKFTGKPPKNEDEFLKIISDQSLSEDARNEVVTAWDAAQAKTD